MVEITKHDRDFLRKLHSDFERIKVGDLSEDDEDLLDELDNTARVALPALLDAADEADQLRAALAASEARARSSDQDTPPLRFEESFSVAGPDREQIVSILTTGTLSGLASEALEVVKSRFDDLGYQNIELESTTTREGDVCKVVVELRDFGPTTRADELAELQAANAELRATMRPHWYADQPTPTSSFRACVATVLRLPVESVPTACDGDAWDWDAFQSWLLPRGLQAVEVMVDREWPVLFPIPHGVPVILCETSPRPCPSGKHAVVAKSIGLDGFELVHDPHPSQEYIVGDPCFVTFFASIDPTESKLTAQLEDAIHRAEAAERKAEAGELEAEALWSAIRQELVVRPDLIEAIRESADAYLAAPLPRENDRRPVALRVESLDPATQAHLSEMLNRPASDAAPQSGVPLVDAETVLFPRESGAICCRRCNPELVAFRMILCPACGNKRCPHATDHRNACTGSNEPGQPGSDY